MRGSPFGCKDVLCFLGSTNRASLRASAAADANVCIDLVLAITLSNCLYGASLNASAAGYAIISNFVSH